MRRDTGDSVPRPLKFMRSWPAGEMGKRRTLRPSFHRIVRDKRLVALLRCPVYAALKVCAKNWMIIPFTLNNIHNLKSTSGNFAKSGISIVPMQL